MYASEVRIIGIAGPLLGFLLGCASHTAPDDWLPEAAETQWEAYGGWVSVRCWEYATTCSDADGELIAVSPDTLYILTGYRLEAIPVTGLEDMVVTAWDPRTGTIAGWAVFGTLLTASNGMFAVISMPIWIIAGTTSAVAQSTAPRERSLRALQRYARFPQGLPPGLDRRTLEPKPNAH